MSCSAWLIRSAATCTGSAVSSARIAISVGPGLGVDADHAPDQPLGGGHVDVARPGDHVDRLEPDLRVAVGERVRSPARRRPRRPRRRRAARTRRGSPGAATRRNRAAAGRTPRSTHAGHLGGHDVHDHAGRVDRHPTRHVQPDAPHRHPALTDRPARHNLHLDGGPPLRLVHGASPLDRLQQRRPDPWVEPVGRRGHRVGGHPRVRHVHPVEAHAGLARGGVATLSHGLDHRRDGRSRGPHVDCGPWQRAPQLGDVDDVGQVYAAQHPASLGSAITWPAWKPPPRPSSSPA